MSTETQSQKTLIRIGISSCLLGKKVRYDGGHKQNDYITAILGPYVKYVPVCPEIEVGMPIPREAVRLEGTPDTTRMVGNRTGEDWTDRMNKYSRQRVRRDDLADLSGFIFKKSSPSCGMERVKLYVKPGTVEKTGVGLFAAAFLEHFPHLPVEEEGRLADPTLRDNFVVRVFAYHRLQDLSEQRFSRGDWVQFHTTHKYIMLAHSPSHYQSLGRLVAAIKQAPAAEFKEKYLAMFMEGLKVKATAKKNVNVLQHIVGFLHPHVTPEDRKELLGAIEDYRQGLVPLIVPITLVSHFVRKHDVAYIKDQVYLSPHPKELMLRNHV